MESCVDDDSEKLGMFDDNNSDFDKETGGIELFSGTSSAQCDCNPAVVKLELVGNILLVLDANDFKHREKTVHGVESSFAEHNPSIVERVESSSAE